MVMIKRIGCRSLPDAGNRVRVERRIATENGDLLGHRLRGEQAVERVAMVKGERCNNSGMFECNRQNITACTREIRPDVRRPR